MVNQSNIKICLMGYPIEHSLSPRLHNYWIDKYKLNGKYYLVETKAKELDNNLNSIMLEGFTGCNLTLPLKSLALNFIDYIDPSAKLSGSINTVVFKNEKRFGYNSDGFGFIESLNYQAPGWRGENIVVLGAGGAARGIIAALKDISGVNSFSIVNRNLDRAKRLAKDLILENYKIYEWEDYREAIFNADMLINCTSLGMIGSKPLEIDLSDLSSSAIVCDIVYNPIITKFLLEAKNRGNTIVEGLPMLLHQGRLGFKHWFGIDPIVDIELYNKIKAGV